MNDTTLLAPPSALRGGALQFLGLCWLFATIALTMQFYVGDLTIYAPGNEAGRAELHQAILTNHPPGGGTWSERGALSTNIRIGAVYLGEGVRRITGWPIAKVYKLQDTAFLFLGLLGTFYFLRRWLAPEYCLLGTLYVVAVLPLTYHFHFFHPWDRPQYCLWLLLLSLIREHRPLATGAALALTMLVKFDAILLPFLYFMANAHPHNWRRTGVETCALLALAAGMFVTLNHLLPTHGEAERFSLNAVVAQLGLNLTALRNTLSAYPPALAHLLPLALALPGLLRRERYVWTAVLFSLGMMVVWITTTNFIEVRAEMPFLLLVLPAALLNLRDAFAPQRALVR